MSHLKVRTAPDPFLLQIAAPVDVVGNSIRKLMDDMLVTMYQDNGVGLAAPQVGVSQRIVVIDLQNDEDRQRPKGFYPLYIVNPEIIEASEETMVANEACLSVPDIHVAVCRPKKITVKYLDYNNKEKVLTTDGWLARAILHEIDHLDGIILLNYLSKLKKDVAIRKLKKLKRLEA